MRFIKSLLKVITAVTLLGFMLPGSLLGAGDTVYPWTSFRHDLLNTGAAADSGYPTSAAVKWKVTRQPSLFSPTTPAGARGSSAVDRGLVFTSGSSVIQANRQDNGTLVWARDFPLTIQTTEPPDTPPDWCYNNLPAASGNGQMTGVCYVPGGEPCPGWCYECTSDLPDCSFWSVIRPLNLPAGYKQFLTGVTLDSSFGGTGALYFNTFDGRTISLDMLTGSTLWERTPFKDPGGPNDGAPWYDQKFAWNLGTPNVYNGKVYFGSFMPSITAIFRPWAYTSGPGYPWPNMANDATHYYAGRDGYVYALDQATGDIVWTWNPRGCGVTNFMPINDGKVFINADTVTDYHYGQFAALDAETGEELWNVMNIALAQGGSMPISGNTIYYPGGDGALWALDTNGGVPSDPDEAVPTRFTTQTKWGYHAGFSVMGHTSMESSPAVDESRGWLIGAVDTGKLFVLDKDTGRVIKEAYMGLPGWQPGDPVPVDGYWFSGPSSPCIVPSQGILYIAGTDFENAWQGQMHRGKEKLFCFDYVSDPGKLILLWEYQMCKDDDCSNSANERIVLGHAPYEISWYSMGTPALADGHVYYASENGYIYCFGD